jgi:tetratricopeptide (TPR) repeat protein
MTTTGADADGAPDDERVAALEEQRDFLLRSLDDLEREWAAGDIDAADYEALKDDYTARTAAVLRALAGRAVATPPPAPAARARDRRTTLAWVVGVLVVGLLAGVLMAQASGRRGTGETVSGDIRETTRQLLADADAAFAEGDIDAAIAAYDEVLAAEPSNAEALTYRGSLLYGQGEKQAGIEQIREATRADETFVNGWSFLLVTLDLEGRTDEAIADIRALIDRGGTDIATAVAQQLAAQDQVLLAIKVYDEILAAEPDNTVALTYRGWLLHLADLDDEAITYLDRALAIEPALPDALAFRAIVLRDLGRLDEAREALAAFDAADPPEMMQDLVDQFGHRDDLAIP